MNAMTYLAATPLERFLGIRDRFATGGSTSGFFAVVGLLALTVLLLALIATLARRRQHRKVYHPRKLFLEVLRVVPLTVPQRDLLRRIARELRLAHPATLLICPRIYHENANAWMSASRNANAQTRELLDGVARAIFGATATAA